MQTFSDLGFEGAGTRLIATRAGVTQGLVTYHFASKDELWRAAADRVFGVLADALPELDGPADGREMLASYVRANAAHPEIFHFIVDAGRHDDERMRWLVDHHLRPRFAQVLQASGVDDDDATTAASLYYAVVGAASVIFALGPECQRLTGAVPEDADTVEAHIELLTSLFVPPR